MDKDKKNRVYNSRTEVLKRARAEKDRLINGGKPFVPPDPVNEMLALADAGLLDDVKVEPPKKEPPIITPPEPPKLEELTPEEKKAIKIQQLEAKLAKLEAEG